MSKSRKSVSGSVALALTLALGSLALPAGSASAQIRKTDPNTVATASTDKNRYEKKTQFDFEDDEVEGTFARPDDLQILSVRRGSHESMVKARASFLPELVKSVEAQ